MAAALLTSVPAAQAATYAAHDGASLTTAIDRANAGSGPSTINLTAGVYAPPATLAIRGDVTIAGPPRPVAKLVGTAVVPAGASLFDVRPGARATFADVLLTNAGQPGTGAAIDDGGSVDLESATLAGNVGPGLIVEPRGRALVRNTTLSDGLAAGLVDHGTAKLINATVAGNAVEGIDVLDGALELVNTIVAGNGSADCSRPAQTADHSLDGDGTCQVGTLGHLAPDLGPLLAANGGPTPTRALAAASPAIDAGDQAQCPAQDQRHYPRSDGGCDIGAYEAGARPGGSPATGGGGGTGPPPAVAPRRGPTGLSGHGSLRGSRTTFVVRVHVAAPHGTLVYGDPARHVRLKSASIASVTIAAGVATIRGSGLELVRRRRVTFVAVVTTRALRIRLSSGYVGGGVLGRGAIALTGGGVAPRCAHPVFGR